MRKHLRRGAVLVGAMCALLVPLALHGLPPSPTTCYAITTIATVCTPFSCATTYYVDDYWCSRTPSTDAVPDPYYRNPADIDQDLVIDDHKDVVKTSDPCAWEFDSNDGLGSDYGGPNTERPDHNGVDIQANRGDPVAAVKLGQILQAGYQVPSDHSAGCGYRVIMQHLGGDVSVYCHMVGDSSRFEVGSWVRAGTVIGQVNSTGNSSGDHLHLIYRDGGSTPIEYWDKTATEPSTSDGSGTC